jgi:hypothetical protein
MRKWYIALAMAACAGIVVLTVRLTRPPEPIYKGKPLSEWIMHYGTYGGPPGSYPQPADDALRHAGTNAVPLLLKWMRYERPGWRKSLDAAAPKFVQRVLRLQDLTSREILADRTIRPLALLARETNALIAMAALAQMMRDTNAPASADRAIRCLSLLGKNGLPHLLSVIADNNYPFRVKALQAAFDENRSDPEAMAATINALYSAAAAASAASRRPASNPVQQVTSALATNAPPR